MSLSFAVYSPPPGSIQQRTQPPEKDKGAADSTTYGFMSALFDARWQVWSVTNDIVVISCHCNSALGIGVNITGV